jgi:hypothetical protein
MADIGADGVINGHAIRNGSYIHQIARQEIAMGLQRIPSKEISFGKVNYKRLSSNAGHDEPYDGLMQWNNRSFYFKLSNEFDAGNRYIVYDEKSQPFAYFSIFTSEGDEGPDELYMDFGAQRL